MTIHDDKHPRGQADNAGQFRDKGNSAPEAVLAHYAAESGNGWISPFVEQVNSKWQVAAVLGGGRSGFGDASIFVGSDIIAGEAQIFSAFRFPAGWRCSSLVNSKLPAQVKQRALASMRSLS